MRKLILNNLKKIIIFLSIIPLIVIWYFLTKYVSEIYYYGNYFEYNKKELILIKDYIDKNKMSGSYRNVNNKYSGDVYTKCAIQKTCFINNIKLVDFLQNLNIAKLNAYVGYSQETLLALKKMNSKEIDTWAIWIEFYPNKAIYWNSDNYIYYSSWFFKWKNEYDTFDGNSFIRIVKIFDNDWWVISGCYGCEDQPW